MTADSIRVALDMEHTRQSRAGVARYSHGLLNAMRGVPGVELVSIGGGPLEERGTLGKRATTMRQDLWWYPRGARRAARAIGARIYHSPLPRGPLRAGGLPTVITVHDLVPLHYPETTTPWSRLYGRLTFERILDAAQLILTPSQDTAQDLQQSLGIPAARIRVVPNGVDDAFFATSYEPSSVPLPFILFVGTPEPRKNLARLTKAVAALRSRGRRESLVIAGGGGWGVQDFLEDGVILVGRVSDAELRVLYSNAACLAIPSLHEGFGLPAIEAMAAGTPVVASDSGALREVAGGAAVLVNPLDTDAIASGIVEAIENRDTLVELGRARAKTFSWARAAELLAAAYRELV